MDILTIAARFLITFVLALAFGLERQRAHKPIGFGTFIFVAIGSCALAVTAMEVAPENPLPLLAAIVSGIGFLGAGALIKTTDKIFGFTNAASIWIFAIFGLTVGIGEYTTAGICYGLIWFVMFFDFYLERRGIGSYQRRLTVTTSKIISENELKTIFQNCRITNHKLITTEMEKPTSRITKTYMIQGSKEDINKLPQEFLRRDWFHGCKLE